MSGVSIYSPPFFAENLDVMRFGTVKLGVPLLDDVIQIGAVTDTRQGQIVVHRGWRSLSIARTDGTLLQAEIITPSYLTDGYAYERTKVFEDPVDTVNLKRRRDLGGRAYWFACDDISVTSREAITKFAQIVGSYATFKQGKTIR